jgi:hypothetical protein
VWAALGPQGLQAMMTVAGATDADVFRAYVKHVLGVSDGVKIPLCDD